MRVALVHDWLTGLRGGERVLDVIGSLYPDAEIFTLLHVPGATTAAIDAHRIRTSSLARLPGIARHYRRWLPLMPLAVRELRIEGADLVLSTHHAFAKAARIAPGTPHLCYCFTPLRYVWDQVDAYLGHGPRRWAAAPLVAALRRFDRRTSGAGQVTRFAAISEEVRRRIRRHYGRESEVLYPPVDLARFRPSAGPVGDYYLLVSAFVPYKSESLAIDAFARLGRRLIVVGDGPLRAAVQARAARSGAPIEFLGRVSDAELATLYSGCRALVQPQTEDLGLVALEAQACGRPVIALARGGARETVRPLETEGDPDAAPGSTAEPLRGLATGIWFDAPTPAALAAAVERFEKHEARFEPSAIRHWAERFSPARFRAGLEEHIERTLAEARRA